MARTSSGSSCSARPVKPTRSAKKTVTTLRSSRAATCSAASAAPQALQKRAPSGFSCPHAGQIGMPEAYEPAGGTSRPLLADRLEDDALAPPPVELGVEDLLPRTEVELPVRDREDDLVRHQLALEVRVGVVLTVVVAVLVGRLVGCEALEPVVEVLDEPGLGVVHVDGGRDVHRIHEAEPVPDAGVLDERLDVARDVDVVAPVRSLERQVVGRMLHLVELGLCRPHPCGPWCVRTYVRAGARNDPPCRCRCVLRVGGATG